MSVPSTSSTPLRLMPGEDLRDALQAAVRAKGQQAAFVVAGIGSLIDAQLRLAAADRATVVPGPSEILSLSGSVGADYTHLHMSLSDAQGRVWGGHVLPGCVVRTAAEVLIAWLPDWAFSREPDPATGYAELVARRRDL
ncbi:MAG: DNA-binding protein [Hydrogenophaga sp.]|uniref:PPC domain-containing DNA-binding protein n=1 Tax=Hydrogenophaga sp. TaxID=1904254 RepID=UPI001E06848D|nr:PPC domain-containing DNA-binding protein [Hydrogenophaga sp.]MBX3609948.1 DNA-binding protein [Hydrogenophaga sp.]